jgi:hypothetical protein
MPLVVIDERPATSPGKGEGIIPEPLMHMDTKSQEGSATVQNPRLPSAKDDDFWNDTGPDKPGSPNGREVEDSFIRRSHVPFYV